MNSGETPDISVVIPVYNSSACLPELLRQLAAVLDARGQAYEIILVDDASPDESWTTIVDQKATHPNLLALRLMRNGGQARATLCGLEYARGEIVITLDDDLQHRPDQLVTLLDALAADREIDCVFGVFARKEHAGYRNAGSRVVQWINARAFGLPKGIRSSSFRVMRRALAEAATRHRTGNPAVAAILCECTNRFKCVTVEHAPRFAGHSGYTLGRQIRLAWDTICNVSMLPLRAASMLGLLACLFSGVMMLVTLARYLMHRVGVPGWTTVIILLSFFAGTTLLTLGVMGEYIARVLREVRNAPRYIIRESIGRQQAHALSQDERSRAEAPR